MALAKDAALDPAKSFQGLILTLQTYWAGHGCVMLQPYDMEVGRAHFIRRRACARSVPSPGRRLTSSRHAGPKTDATVRTPIGCSTIISIR